MKKITFIYLLLLCNLYSEVEFKIVENKNNKITILAKANKEKVSSLVPLIEKNKQEVIKGDTLSEIASKASIDMDKLILLNRIEDPNLIYYGKDLIVPLNNEVYVEKLEIKGSLEEFLIAEEVTLEELKTLNTQEDIENGLVKIIRHL